MVQSRERDVSPQSPADLYMELSRLFKPYEQWKRNQPRGGKIRRGKPFHNGTKLDNLNWPVPLGSNFHREQSFEEDAHLPWIREVSSRLTSIANGRYLPDVSGIPSTTEAPLPDPLPFAQRFAKRVIDGDLAKKPLHKIILDTMMEDFSLFEHRYPYLMPVFAAMFSVAGIAGVDEVIRRTRINSLFTPNLFDIVEGNIEYEPEERRSFVSVEREGQEFGSPARFELACLGENYGQQVLAQLHRGTELFGAYGKVITHPDTTRTFVMTNGTRISTNNIYRQKLPNTRTILEPFIQQLQADAQTLLGITGRNQ